MLGYQEDEFGEQMLASYVHPDDRPAWDAHVDEVLDYPTREHTLELRLRHADGRWRWMEAHAVNRAVNSVKNDTEECIEPVAD